MLSVKRLLLGLFSLLIAGVGVIATPGVASAGLNDYYYHTEDPEHATGDYTSYVALTMVKSPEPGEEHLGYPPIPSNVKVHLMFETCLGKITVPGRRVTVEAGGYRNEVIFVTFDKVITRARKISWTYQIEDHDGAWSHGPFTWTNPAKYVTPCPKPGDPEEPTVPEESDSVKVWSKKKLTNNRVGKKISITPTQTSEGATVKYKWFVGKKTIKVGSSRVLKIKKTYVGKKIRVRVIVKSNKILRKTLGFGKAKK